MIKYLIMDVDGTLTDGKIYMGMEGEVFKAFDIKDGCGIHDILIPSGIVPIIITGRKSKITENRCKELGISHLYQGVENKKDVLVELIKRYAVNLNSVSYIGDDINDMECMTLIKNEGGVIGCPQDAIEDVKQIVNYICKSKGGYGAVREFIDIILNSNNGEKSE